MTLVRKQLLETMAGHFALLKATHPRQASSPVAKRARQAVRYQLRHDPVRKAAA